MMMKIKEFIRNIKSYFITLSRKRLINTKKKRQLLEYFEIGIKINRVPPFTVGPIRYYEPDNMYIILIPELNSYIKLDKKTFDKAFSEISTIS